MAISTGSWESWMEVIILQTCCLRVRGSRSRRYLHSPAWTWTDEVNMELLGGTLTFVIGQIIQLTVPWHVKLLLRIYCRSASKEHGKNGSGSHFPPRVPYAAHLHTSHHVSHVSDFIVSSELIFYFILFFYIMLCFASFMFYFLAFCMCVCCRVCSCMLACVRVLVCMRTCWHPEEEGRPRRRRTPRFLLKPWCGSRQAAGSRLGLQVKRKSSSLMCLLTRSLNCAFLDSSSLWFLLKTA